MSANNEQTLVGVDLDNWIVSNRPEWFIPSNNRTPKAIVPNQKQFYLLAPAKRSGRKGRR